MVVCRVVVQWSSLSVQVQQLTALAEALGFAVKEYASSKG